jgi:hypothetical protein
LKSVKIPNVVTGIGDFAFAECDSLTSISLPDEIVQYNASDWYFTIGDSAFRECRALTSITIPECVTKIGQYAFRGCRSLASVTFYNIRGWWVALDSTATDGESISRSDLGNESTAATYLTENYVDCYWRCF